MHSIAITDSILSHSVSDIREDIMSPRTVTNTNMTSTAPGDAGEFPKTDPNE